LYKIMTQRIATAGARKHFASLVKQSARGERITITRYNKTAVVLIPKKDLDALEDCEKELAARKSTG
jgi:prevent-host-death family protein